jgi:hypothetical protein
MSARSDVKLMFKGILAAETEKKAGAQAMNQGYMVNSTLHPLIKAGSYECWAIIDRA